MIDKNILTTSDHEFFQSQGYFIVEKAFPEKNLAELHICLKNLLDITILKAKKDFPRLNWNSANYNFDQLLIELTQLDSKYISFIQRTIIRTAEFFRISSERKVSKVIKELMNLPNVSPIYMTSNGIVFTCPQAEVKGINSGNFDLGWHLDTFYTIPKSRFVQVWAPLFNDATMEIGTLIVCPGSNKINPINVKQKFNPALGFNNQYHIDDDEVLNYEHQSIELKVGQLLVFDGRLIHRSGKNISNQVRCSLIGLYHDINQQDFVPITAPYKYHAMTPEEYFFDVYKDDRLIPHLTDNAVSNRSLGGV